MKNLKFLAIFIMVASIIFSASGCSKGSNQDGVKPSVLKLYFADKEAQFLLLEKRELNQSMAATPKEALAALIAGPKVEGHFPTIPKGSELLGIEIEDGLVSVDFNMEFKNNYQLGSAAEGMTIYSIVNTLTEFNDIKRVRFLVEGKALDIAGSNYDFTVQTFERDEDLISTQKKEK